jgi:hypothetical protein
MGQFEDNSMNMQVRSFDAEDSCVVDMQMCAEANNTNNVLFFNVEAVGQVGVPTRSLLVRTSSTVIVAPFIAGAIEGGLLQY